MSNTTVAWNENAPADADVAGFGAADIRSTKTALSTMLGAEHVFPISTGQMGAHKAGSARAFVGSGSQVSSADTTGRMMFDSTTSRLWHVGSGVTYPVGGPGYISMTPGQYPANFATPWFQSISTAITVGPGVGAINNVAVNSPISFIGRPTIFLTMDVPTGNGPAYAAVDYSNFTTFQLVNLQCTMSASTTTINMLVIGPGVLA